MAEDVRVGTAGVFEGVGQDAEPLVVEVAGWKVTVVVDGLGELGDGAAVPGEPYGGEGYAVEKVAEEVAE
jgi:hypothetical protein